MTSAIATTSVYHYLMPHDPADRAAAIVRQGLLPLSAQPGSDRYRAVEAARPGFYAQLYRELAAPVLGAPYRHSGIFLTPIDFRRLGGHPMAGLGRVVVPAAAIPAASAVLTDVWQGLRRRWLFGASALTAMAACWDDDAIRAWYGRDATRVFWFLPQACVYVERLPVRAEWLE